MTAEPIAPLMKPEEVSELLGIPKQTLYKWRHHNEGPKAIRIGKHLRYRTSDIDAWLTERAEVL